jgi:hypothetical protein
MTAARNFDRVLFVRLYRIAPRILDTLTIVQPETVLRWQRAGFKPNTINALATGTLLSSDQ